MRHKSTIRYLVFFAGLFLSQFGLAQMMYDTLTLGELEIFADKADYTATTRHQSIDSIYLHKLNNADLGEALASYTPVFIRSYGKGSLATASFRGTGANHTQVLWNDFRINSPMLGQSDFSLLPVFFFDKVELYYGGASLSKSEGGLGGSINLFSSPETNAKPGIRFSQSYGSFNTWSTDAGIVLGNKKYSSDTRFIYQSSINDFPYFNNAILPSREMVQKNAGYYNYGFTQQFAFKPGKGHTISLGSWTQWNHQDIPPLMAKAEASDNVKEFSDDFFSRNFISWKYQRKRSFIEAKGAWFYDDYQYHQTILNNDIPNTLINSKNKVRQFSGKIKYSVTLNKGFRLVTGLDYANDKAISNNYAEAKTRNTIGVYGDIKKNFSDRVYLNLFLRSQLTDGKFLPLMPLLGLNIKILKNKNLYFRTSLSGNYHLPTLNDLYWYPNGNENLQPEQSVEWEAGLNYVGSIGDQLLVKADVTGYLSKVSDWIQWVDTGNSLWAPENLKKVFTRGVEVSSAFEGNAGKLNYHLFMQYAFTRTTQEKTDSNQSTDENYQLIYIPIHSANGDVNIALKGYFVNWHVHFVGTQNVVGGTLDAFLLNGTMLGKSWQFGKSFLQVCGKVNNLFNVSYQVVAGRAMPGRNYEIKINYQFN